MPQVQDSYQLLDSGNFQKLEQVGPFRLVRPSPQAVWRPTLPASDWSDVDARYTRFSGGNGKWTLNKKFPESWAIQYCGINLVIRLTDFGHIGLFAEQGPNWLQMQSLLKRSEQRPLRVLNLFAYTGGASLACALGGAEVVHLDASKTSVAWARENAQLNGEDLAIRWIVEDVKKFVAREVRRGSKYHGIIIDPPSFGRGTKNEVWKIEDDLPALLDDLRGLLDHEGCFVLLSSHTSAYTPLALKSLLSGMVGHLPGEYEIGEMAIPEVASSHRLLPSGSYCLFRVV